MTVETATRRVNYLGDGTTTAFPVSFRFDAAGDLNVLLTTPAGASAVLTLNVDYVVAGAGVATGGTVSTVLPPAAGTMLQIKRVVARTQTIDYTPFGPFPAETTEQALDRLTMMAQEDGDNFGRAVLLPDGDPAIGSMILPPAIARAGGGFLGFAAGGILAVLSGTGVDGALRTDLANGYAGTALIAYLAPSIGAVVESVSDIVAGLGFRPESYGVDVGTGGDDTAAFAAMSAAVNAAGGGRIYLRPVNYNIGEQTYQAANTGNYLYAPTPGFAISGCTKPVVIVGNGATLRQNAAQRFGSFNLDGSRYDPAAGGYIVINRAAALAPLISITSCTGGWSVENVTLDGNIANLTIGGYWGDVGYQLPGDGLFTYLNIGGGHVTNLRTVNNGRDGWYLNDAFTGITAPVYGGSATNVVAEYNARQGFSIGGGCGWTFGSCRGSHTGRGAANIGSAPSAGWDIEAENGNIVRNITWINCDAIDNAGVGVLADVGNATNLTWRGGRIIGTTSYAMWPAKPGFVVEDALIVGAIISAYPGDGGTTANAARFVRCRITDDVTLSPTGAVTVLSGFLFNVGGAGGGILDDCDVVATQPGTGAIYSAGGTVSKSSRWSQVSTTNPSYPRATFSGPTSLSANFNLLNCVLNATTTIAGVRQRWGQAPLTPGSIAAGTASTPVFVAAPGLAPGDSVGFGYSVALPTAFEWRVEATTDGFNVALINRSSAAATPPAGTITGQGL